MLRRVVAESLGAALLLTAIVGAGIMSDRLANGNLALELLAVSITAALWFTSSEPIR